MVEEKSGIETHNTCTSTPLENTPGSKKEHISQTAVDSYFSDKFGYPVSNNPVVARIQREQAIRKSKIKINTE